MQVRTITVNAAGLAAAERGIQVTGLSGRKQVQAKANLMSAPECEVTISQEGRKRSRQQAAYTETNMDMSAQKTAAKSSQSYPPQKQYKDLREALTEMYKWNGFTGDELIERVNATYEEACRSAQGGIQFSLNQPSDEAKAAVKELAQKAVKVEDIVIDPSRAKDLLQAAQEYQGSER